MPGEAQSFSLFLRMIQTVSIVGAGTMGSGIALAASLGKFPAIICDINPSMLESARSSIEKNLQFLVDKEKISAEDKIAALNRVSFTTNIEDCTSELVVEEKKEYSRKG